MESMGAWVSLIDFAFHNRINLRILRGHLKAGTLPFKMEGGCCKVWDHQGPYQAHHQGPYQAHHQLLNTADFPVFLGQSPKRSSENDSGTLAEQLKRTQRELAEVRTLLAFYEDNARKEPPSVQATYIRAFLEPEL